MIESLQRMVGTAVMDRLVLLINHVLASEPEATRRLSPQAGRRVELQPSGWPALLPRLPRLAFLVTPAGLVEWVPDGSVDPADLTVSFDASNPAWLAARGLTGKRPVVEVAGDAQLAADVSWLMDNLRWDVADDLARLVGDGPARELSRMGEMLAEGVRRAVGTLSGLVSRARPHAGARAGDPSPR